MEVADGVIHPKPPINISQYIFVLEIFAYCVYEFEGVYMYFVNEV